MKGRAVEQWTDEPAEAVLMAAAEQNGYRRHQTTATPR
jgi:hypothetical protein